MGPPQGERKYFSESNNRTVRPEMRISWCVLISWANEPVTVVCLFVIPAIFRRESTPRPLLDTRLKTAGMTRLEGRAREKIDGLCR
jgi:hypothetical protein